MRDEHVTVAGGLDRPVVQEEIAMKTTTHKAVAATLIMTALAFGSAARASDYDLSWFTLDCGGGYSAGGDFELEGTIGQSDAGPAAAGMSGGTFELVGGFWSAVDSCSGAALNLAAYANFAACLAGPDISTGPACTCLDLDADGDADLRDFAKFQVNFAPN
jgi:hypothetical protein